MRTKDNKCTALPLGLSPTDSFTITAIAGLLIFTAAIGFAGILVGVIERLVAGKCNCLVACSRWLCRKGASNTTEEALGENGAASDTGPDTHAKTAVKVLSSEGLPLTPVQILEQERIGKIMEVC